MESFRIINIIADAVLAMKVADERVTRIKTTELSMTLGRHTPTKLVGLSIEGGDGRFVLPDEKGTLDSSTGNTAFVDSQVSCHKSASFLKNSRMSTAPSNKLYNLRSSRDHQYLYSEAEELQSRAENWEETLWWLA